MVGRAHLSIGEVLSLLHEEFPDVTISKIRFLESQGLVDPERTPSGYRKFYEPDIERLRWVLRQQRDAFLPLKVIKDRLEEQADPDADEPGAGEGLVEEGYVVSNSLRRCSTATAGVRQRPPASFLTWALPPMATSARAAGAKRHPRAGRGPAAPTPPKARPPRSKRLRPQLPPRGRQLNEMLARSRRGPGARAR